ncbi:MAG: putative Ig domain-containing protein [Holophagaceae bacterium]|nr:putative Ig domain-containing protein [Holophagaceae bacterium]
MRMSCRCALTTFSMACLLACGGGSPSGETAPPPPAAITLGPSSLPNGTAGVAYSQVLTASGGTSPYTFTVSSGSLPGGLSLSSAGTLSGTPATAGASSFSVQARDSANRTGTQIFALVVSASVSGPMVRIGAGTGKAIKPLLGINAGPLPASPSMTANLATAYQTIGVRAVRTHDHLIYPSGQTGPGPLDMSTLYPNRALDPNAQGSYDFTISDQHFSAIISGGFEPFFRLGDSAALAKAPTPSERANWVQAGVQVIRHYKEAQWNGYSGAIKAVEIWNEPDSVMFWSRSLDEFLSLYVDTAKALRAAHPTLLIGGPGFTHAGATNFSSTGWLKKFLDKVQAEGAPLDFLSYHVYTNDPEQPASMAAGLRTELDGRGLTGTAIYLTEWNTFTDPVANLDQARLLRSGALGCSILTAGWIRMQDASIDRLFHYRGNDTNSNTPEGYGLFLGVGTAKLNAYAFQAWSKMASTTERLSVDLQGDSNLRALAGRDGNGKPVILVVNLGDSSSSWTPTDLSNLALAGPWQLWTLSDASQSPQTTTPAFPIAIPARGVQVLSVP